MCIVIDEMICCFKILKKPKPVLSLSASNNYYVTDYHFVIDFHILYVNNKHVNIPLVFFSHLIALYDFVLKL